MLTPSQGKKAPLPPCAFLHKDVAKKALAVGYLCKYNKRKAQSWAKTTIVSGVVGHLAPIEPTANPNTLWARAYGRVQTMVFNGEPFFGQDRINTLRWRLDKVGVPQKGSLT